MNKNIESIPLGKICKEVYRYPSYYGIDYVNEGIPEIRGELILESGLLETDPKKLRHISSETAAKFSRTCLDSGDLVMSVRGTIGKTGLVSESLKGANITANLIRIAPDRDLVEPKYLWHFMRTDRFRKILDHISPSTTIKTIRSPDLKEILVPLPPIAEQRRIAAILDKADAIRRKRKQAIQYTEELLRATFLNMFGDPENSSYPVRSLEEVCLKITDGAHFTPTYVERGIPFLRVTDIQGERIEWKNVKYIPVEEHQELIKRCHPQKGDILYSKNGTIGISKIIDWDKEFSIFVSLALLKPNKNLILSEYLESFLKTPFALRQALSHTKTGTVSNLHLVEIRKVKLPIPEMQIQEEWISVKSETEIASKKIIRLAEESDNLFNSLLQRAFRGEL